MSVIQGFFENKLNRGAEDAGGMPQMHLASDNDKSAIPAETFRRLLRQNE
jgi:hypothetical protein